MQGLAAPGFEGSGTLEATEITVSALSTGTILKLTKDKGDEVKKQDLLAEIDVEKLILQRAQLAAGLKEIEAGRIGFGPMTKPTSDMPLIWI